MKCMYVACVQPEFVLRCCLNLRSCFLRPSDQIMWKLWFSLHETLYPARCLYWERELYIYFCKFIFSSHCFLSFHRPSFPAVTSRTFRSRTSCLQEGDNLVFCYISSGPDIFGYMRGKKRIMKSTLLKCLITTWFTHWAFGAAWSFCFVINVAEIICVQNKRLCCEQKLFPLVVRWTNMQSLNYSLCYVLLTGWEMCHTRVVFQGLYKLEGLKVVAELAPTVVGLPNLFFDESAT